MGIKKIVLTAFSTLLFAFNTAYAQQTVQYEITYAVTQNSLNITYSVSSNDTAQSVSIVAALYNKDKLCKMISKPVLGMPNTQNIVFDLPQSQTQNYSVKAFVWDSMKNLKPLGSIKPIKDIEPYFREKTLFVSANAGESIKIFMSADNATGNNINAEHTVIYNPQKFVPADLCLFTYEKELSACNVENTGIVIKRADTQNGTVVFGFNTPDGRNTGINNVAEFTALCNINEDILIYKIQ